MTMRDYELVLEAVECRARGMSFDFALTCSLLGSNHEAARRIWDSPEILPMVAARADMVNAERYRWEREHPAWETEAYLSGLTPEEYDAAIDKARGVTNGDA